jgi:PAS domain S-box-containing protein
MLHSRRYQGVPMALDLAPAERVPAIRPDYLLVADCIPGLIGITGPDGAVESCNRAVLEYFGATLEEIQGWTSSKLVHPDDIPAVIARQKRSVETGERLLSEHRLLRADGVYRWFQIHGEPLRNSQGEIVQWRYYAKRIRATTTEIKASHVPFLSHPKEVARVIEAAAK